MKALYRLVSCALAALMLLAFGLISSKTGAEDCLRLHVIANSDSDEDQRVKLLVRDALLEEFSKGEAADVGDAKEAEEMLRLLGPRLQEAAERVLEEEGAEYSVTLESGVFEFPDREYGDRLYPAGEYNALRVVLGDGEGKNWWCVMFPPLCVIDDGSGVQYNEDGTLKFRSFFAELFGRLFG